MQFSFRYVIWNILLFSLLVASVVTNIKGLDNLWFFIAYALPVTGSLMLFVFFLAVYYAEIINKLPEIKKALTPIYKIHNPKLLVFDNFLDVVLVWVFVYYGWTVLAVLWLIYNLFKMWFFSYVVKLCKESSV